MQGAEITPDAQSKKKQTTIPSLVEQDDIERELGRWVIVAIQKDKIIQRLVAQIQAQAATIKAQKEVIDKIPKIKRSNNQLDEKNRALAATNDTLRKERNEAISKASVANTERQKAVDALAKAREEIGRLQGLCDRLQAEVAARDEEIEKLKKPRRSTKRKKG